MHFFSLFCHVFFFLTFFFHSLLVTCSCLFVFILCFTSCDFRSFAKTKATTNFNDANAIELEMNVHDIFLNISRLYRYAVLFECHMSHNLDQGPRLLSIFMTFVLLPVERICIVHDRYRQNHGSGAKNSKWNSFTGISLRTVGMST